MLYMYICLLYVCIATFYRYVCFIVDDDTLEVNVVFYVLWFVCGGCDGVLHLCDDGVNAGETGEWCTKLLRYNSFFVSHQMELFR